MNRRLTLSTSLAVVAAVAIALLPVREAFSGNLWVLRTLGASVAAALIANLVELRRQRVTLPVLTVITAAGAILWPLLTAPDGIMREPDSFTPWRRVRDGLFDGWNSLLADDIQLSDEQNAQVFLGIVVWVLTATAVHALARRGNSLVASIAIAAVLWFGVVASLPYGPTPAVIGAGVGCALLVVVATLTRAPGQRWSTGRGISLVLMIVTAGGLGLITPEVLPGTRAEPFDPRGDRGALALDVEVPDILAEYSERSEDESLRLKLESTTGELLPEIRLRLQVYDVHDGQRWLPTIEFEEVAQIPEPEFFNAGEIVTLNISLMSDQDPWIPLPGTVIASNINDLQWSEATQTALKADFVGDYSVTGAAVARDGLEGLRSARDEVDPRYTEIPRALPEEIRQAALQATSAANDALSANNALVAFVRGLGRSNQTAPGHSLGRLRDDLAVGRPTGPEQLASLHALMARTLGHPSRLVVGYVANQHDLSGADLHVWTEIAFPSRGWVSFDPVPMAETAAETAPDQTTTTTIAEDTAVEAQLLPRELEPGEDTADLETPRPVRDTSQYLLLALVGLGAAVVVGLPLIRSIRRQRRRRPQQATDTRLLGAWAEVVDRVREAGIAVPETTTNKDVVTMAETIDADFGTAVARLATLASAAMHARPDPTPERADEAWAVLADAEAALRQARGRRSRVARWVDPRVLRHRAPTR